MKLIESPIKLEELTQMASMMFGDMVKVVVDIEKKIIVVDGEMHSDEEGLLLETGSKQTNLWGINLYPQKKGSAFIEFDSMINLRPSQNNRSRGIESMIIRKKIIKIISSLIEK